MKQKDLKVIWFQVCASRKKISSILSLFPIYNGINETPPPSPLNHTNRIFFVKFLLCYYFTHIIIFDFFLQLCYKFKNKGDQGYRHNIIKLAL